MGFGSPVDEVRPTADDEGETDWLLVGAPPSIQCAWPPPVDVLLFSAGLSLASDGGVDGGRMLLDGLFGEAFGP